jgi:uncharacterized RDD family membrane protein YckC
MTTQNTLPPRTGQNFADQPHAYDPVKDPQLFQGVIRKRSVAFIVDAIIILALTVVAYVVVALLGIVTLGLAWPCSAWSSPPSASVTMR